MGTSLNNTKIKDTFQGLIKTTDNSTVGSSNKELTDGSGNDLNISVNNTGAITADGNITAANLIKTGGTSTQILLATGAVVTLTIESSGISSNDNDTSVPTNASVKDFVDTEIANLVDSSPAALDTLNELAAALGDDANFSTTVNTALGNRLRIDVNNQGLSATQKTNALTNLGITSTPAEVNILDGATLSTAELNFVDGVTSNIQTQINGLQSQITGGATTITDSDLTASRALVSDSSGKVSASNVTSAEIDHLDGVTSSIQTQLDAKQATITGAATTIDDADLSTSRAVVSDTSGKVAVSTTTSTEIGFVSGVTSAIQTQIDSKQDTITGAATTIDDTDLTVSRALVSNGSGKVAVSDVTSTELGYLDGVTSGIQSQISSKQNIAEPHSTAAQTFTVTVAAKTAAHREYGNGSSNGYLIDGVEAPYLNITVGNTYQFDQSDSSNATHPLRFYLEADKTTAYTDGVTTNGTAGSAGAYTQIIATESTPQVLYYQCSSHAYMGNTINFAGAVQASGAHAVNVISSNTTASSRNLYVLTATLTLTLPASPSNGDSVKISNRSGVATATIGRNSEKIMGAAEDLTIDRLNAGFEMIYTGSAQGWVIISLEGTAS